MLRQIIAWDADGNVIATLDYMVAKDEDGNVIGLLDFEAHENAGGRMREIVEVERAVGSGTWPEWIGAKAHDFKVELDPAPAGQRAKIAALVHKKSGHRRERAAIEAEIEKRVKAAKEKPADLRDLLGGPNRPLLLDDQGRTRRRAVSARPQLPFVPAGKGRPGPPSEHPVDHVEE